MALLEVASLSLSFGGVHALKDVNWTIEEGSVSALIGPNGAGKTTLFNCVTGYLRPLPGSKVSYAGEDVTGWGTHRLSHRGLVRTFQHPKGFGSRTLRSNIEAVLRANGRDPAAAGEPIEELGLADYADSAVSAVPYGVARRLNIAIALALEPRLLMLDEPAAGLSDHETGLLGTIVERLRKRGTTIVLVEHNMRFVMSNVDTLTVLDAGSVIARGTPKEIASDPTVLSVYLGERAVAAH